jgi:muramoyltetrapeptide carboxypeptidase
MQFISRPVIRPRRLNRGDTIGIVAPSSPFDIARFEQGINLMHDLGFSTRVDDGLFRRRGYLAGSDRHRAEQFNAMVAGDGVQAVMCARGGFGALRILDYLDFDAIRHCAKPIIGFSDVTALHQAIFLKSGLVTFHGPTVTTLARSDTVTVQAWCDALTNPGPAAIDLSGAVFLKPGSARGVVRGGNLATLCHMLGTPYLDDFRGALVLLEDTGEALYRIDRMLSQMKMAGFFDGIAGLLLGGFEHCGAADALNALVLEVFSGRDLPIVAGLDIGHGMCNITIPMGLTARLDSDGRVLDFFTSAFEG